jgi:hypothetical protein
MKMTNFGLRVKFPSGNGFYVLVKFARAHGLLQPLPLLALPIRCVSAANQNASRVWFLSGFGRFFIPPCNKRKLKCRKNITEFITQHGAYSIESLRTKEGITVPNGMAQSNAA